MSGRTRRFSRRAAFHRGRRRQGEEARLAPERPRYAGSGRQISSALSYEH